jgi:hypothetical protein
MHTAIKAKTMREEDTVNAITTEPGVIELTRDEGRAMLDQRVRRVLGISLGAFEAAYDSGTLDMSRSDVIGLVLLLPFAR